MVVEMFQRRGWRAILIEVLEDLDFFKNHFGDDPKAICFTGGTDVNPEIYGEERGPTTEEPDRERDAFEVALYERFKDTDVYLFGICRGAQLLNVLNGGKMIQECGYRGGQVEVTVSDALEDAMNLDVPMRQDGRYPVYLEHDVCHHQGMFVGRESDNNVVFGWSHNEEKEHRYLDYVIHYPKTRSYGVQGHPEWGHKETEDLFFAGVDLVMKYQEGN